MPLTKKEFANKLAQRMNTTEKNALQWIDAYTETLIEIFETGNGVSISGLGGFHVSPGYSSTMKFKFNPSQKIRKIMGWSSTYKGE